MLHNSILHNSILKSGVGTYFRAILGSKLLLELYANLASSVTIFGGQVSNWADQSSLSNDFPQSGGASATPLSDGISKIIFDAVGEFLDGSSNIDVFKDLSSGMVSWTANPQGPSVAVILALANSATDIDYLSIGLHSDDKMRIISVGGIETNQLFSTNVVNEGDICQIQSTGSLTKMWINNVEETVVEGLGTNRGLWFDSPDEVMDKITIGSLPRLNPVYYATVMEDIIVTTGETEADRINIYNHLNSRP